MGNLYDQMAGDFYIEFHTVCQHEGDDLLPEDVAKWAGQYVLRDMWRWSQDLKSANPPSSVISAYAKEHGIEL